MAKHIQTLSELLHALHFLTEEEIQGIVSRFADAPPQVTGALRMIIEDALAAQSTMLEQRFLQNAEFAKELGDHLRNSFRTLRTQEEAKEQAGVESMLSSES